MRRALPLLMLALLLMGCSASADKKQAAAEATKQAELADQLYWETKSHTVALLKGEVGVTEAITHRDAVPIEELIGHADDFKYDWHKKAAAATGPVAEAANAYEDSLATRIKAYEAASRTARFGRVEDSREMTRLQREGWDAGIAAADQLGAISKQRLAGSKS